MAAEDKNKHVIRLERDNDDYILPKNFFDILVLRFFPVISLTYLASIIGIAAISGEFIQYLFLDRKAYLMGILLVFWVSVPAIVWILLVGNPMLTHVADIWYKILSGLLMVTIGLSYVLFPEAKLYGLREYFVLSIPIFILIYLIFVRDNLSKLLVYPLNALGFCALIWGMFMGAVISV